MSTIRLCPECGKPLPEGFSGGCPACALRGALELSGAPVATEVVAAEQPSDRIGRYKLLQKIGEGGMGTVWMAEQEEPIRRRVALKIIKLGMDTKQVIGRFEAERQALALMDHPNIAKVLDAGATDTGRPFFVMELVKGIPITNYCDDHKLGTVERLKLFTDVCHAIQHAHQKGIIHRDIKPSNILVTHNDGVPMPKVIDFGIAKATGGQTLTDKTVFTAFEQFIGTPAYMSPEQAEMNALDIDTRSDIYALGVLLYELLTGKTPFEAKALIQAGLDEMRRIIREQEPVRPSTRISTLDKAEQTKIAGCRHAEAPKLAHLVRGDLDWIVMKTLEKDRTRRYATASGLALDIQHHLNSEPVTARPPSNAYRFQKMVRRNKLAFAAGTALAAAVLVGLAVSTFLFIQERQAHEQTLAAEHEQGRLRIKAEAEATRAEAAATEVKAALSTSDFLKAVDLIAPPPKNHPVWLLQLAEASSGQVLNVKDLLEPTHLDRAETINQIRQELNQASRDDAWVQWGRSFLADTGTPLVINPGENNTVSIISTTPPSPAVLHLNERMTVNIRYSCKTRAVQLWVKAYGNNRMEPRGFFTNGSRVFTQISGGDDTDYCQFGCEYQADVHEVEVTMIDLDSAAVLARTTLPIEAHWK